MTPTTPLGQQLQDYAQTMAQKAARSAYAEAARTGNHVVQQEIRRALRPVVTQACQEVQQQLAEVQQRLVKDYQNQATTPALQGLQEVTHTLQQLTVLLSQVLTLFADQQKTAPPRTVRRRVERDNDGRICALVEESL